MAHINLHYEKCHPPAPNTIVRKTALLDVVYGPWSWWVCHNNNNNKLTPLADFWLYALLKKKLIHTLKENINLIPLFPPPQKTPKINGSMILLHIIYMMYLLFQSSFSR